MDSAEQPPLSNQNLALPSEIDFRSTSSAPEGHSCVASGLPVKDVEHVEIPPGMRFFSRISMVHFKCGRQGRQAGGHVARYAEV